MATNRLGRDPLARLIPSKKSPVKKKTSKEAPAEKMVFYNIKMPESVHTALKKEAADLRVTMNKHVLGIIVRRKK